MKPSLVCLCFSHMRSVNIFVNPMLPIGVVYDPKNTYIKGVPPYIRLFRVKVAFSFKIDRI